MGFILRGPFLFPKNVYFCIKLRKMTETIATTSATTAQCKAAILELIQENNPQWNAWAKSVLTNNKKAKPKNGQPKNAASRSELPFWKAHPDWEPMTPPEGGSISLETLEKLQELFKDAPPAEEMISYLTK
jgi:hypothetical protein